MDTKQFSAWILVMVASTSSILISNLWYSVYYNGASKTNSDNTNERDYGMLYLAIALFLWSVSGFSTQFLSNGMSVTIIKSFFSTLNSCFLLLGSTHLEFSPKWIISNRNKYKNIIIWTAIFVIFSTTILQYYFDSNTIITSPDFLFSIITILLLSYSLFVTFWKREIKVLSFFSIIVLLILLLTQQAIVLFFEIEQNHLIILSSLYSRISFIIIICFLVYSRAQINFNTASTQVNTLSTKVVSLEERVKNEREMANRDERDLAWQDIASKAAHKIGNPIDAIDTFTQRIIRRLRVDDIKTVKSILVDMNESIEDAKHVLSEFKSLTRLGEIKPQRFDIMRLIHQASKIIKEDDITKVNIEISIKNPKYFIEEHSIEGGILKVGKSKADETLFIHADKEKIKQCIDELLSNSLHFFNKDQKNIFIQLEYITNEHNIGDSLSEAINKQKQCVKIIYSDNGIGVKNEDKKSIFNPFYTTYQHGTGLGLSIVQKIIELHNGNIIENGQFEIGANFEIILPLEYIKQ